MKNALCDATHSKHSPGMSIPCGGISGSVHIDRLAIGGVEEETTEEESRTLRIYSNMHREPILVRKNCTVAITRGLLCAESLSFRTKWSVIKINNYPCSMHIGDTANFNTSRMLPHIILEIFTSRGLISSIVVHLFHIFKD